MKAPNYRPGNSGDSCATCVHYIGGSCDLYDFEAASTYTCDSHTPREESGPVRASVMRKHSAMKIAMPFLKQDRPEKVKKIYRALKRDHPDMPAEMKARIAARQGKPGKQKQGPPYKAPIKPWKEKTAMKAPSTDSILKALAVTGGLATSAGAGYAVGRRKGRKEDAKTPYGPTHMRYAYRKGQQDLANRLRARIASRRGGSEKKALDMRSFAAGAGLAGLGAAGGYIGGRAHGKKIDKKTPYGGRHMQYAYRKGQQDLANRLRSRIASRRGQQKTAGAEDTGRGAPIGSAVGSIVPLPFARTIGAAIGGGSGADTDRKGMAQGGAAAGSIVGSALGAILGAAAASMVGAPLGGGFAGATAGGAYGAYRGAKWGHGKEKKAFVVDFDSYPHLGIPHEILGF